METGRFVLLENHFIAGGHKFVIKKRKKQREKKPEFYLIELEPFRYISSLFPVELSKPDKMRHFTFDYERQVYIMRAGDTEVEIAELE